MTHQNAQDLNKITGFKTHNDKDNGLVSIKAKNSLMYINLKML